MVMFPKPELHLTIRVVILFACGIVASVAYYRIVARLKKAGIRTPMFRNVQGVLRTFETYRRLAPEQSWPTWPVKAYWFALAIGAMIVMSVYFFPLK